MKITFKVVAAVVIGTAIVLNAIAYSHEAVMFAKAVRSHFDGSYEVHYGK